MRDNQTQVERDRVQFEQQTNKYRDQPAQYNHQPNFISRAERFHQQFAHQKSSQPSLTPQPSGSASHYDSMANNTSKVDMLVRLCEKFNYCTGDVRTLGERWERWTEQFMLALRCSGITDNSLIKSTFLALVGLDVYRVYKANC